MQRSRGMLLERSWTARSSCSVTHYCMPKNATFRSEATEASPMLTAYRLFRGAARRDGYGFAAASELWKSSSIREVFVESVSEKERKKRKY